MNVTYINPFIETTSEICLKAANISAKLGKPYLKRDLSGHDKLIVSVGLTGELRGYVYLIITIDDALYVATKMINNGKQKVLDELSKSAIKELMNMIIGNTATLFSTRGIQINMTPPNLLHGNDIQISAIGDFMLCAPIILDYAYKLEMAVSIE